MPLTSKIAPGWYGSWPGLSIARVAIFALMLAPVFALTACGAAEDPILPTLRPTFTPSLEPSATPTRVFNASPTPTPVRASVATAGPSPTPLIGIVPTRPLFTVTPTLISYAPGTLQIDYFTTNATVIQPGDKITLFWAAKGVDKAIIYRLDADGKRGQLWNVNRAGSMDVATLPTDRGQSQFLLSIGNIDTHLEQTISIPIGCTENWFFDPQPDGCPADPVVVSAEVSQPFEHGTMIWVAAQTRIYVLFNDGGSPAWATYPDEFKDGQPASDPAFSPPSGLFQPIRGFGLVWRSREKVRQRLGWATGPELPYDGALQGDGMADNGAMYIRGKDGNIFGLFNKGASWKLITP